MHEFYSVRLLPSVLLVYIILLWNYRPQGINEAGDICTHLAVSGTGCVYSDLSPCMFCTTSNASRLFYCNKHVMVHSCLPVVLRHCATFYSATAIGLVPSCVLLYA